MGGSSRCGHETMVNMFDAQQSTEALQEAVRLGDREHLESSVSDSMIWVMPSSDNQRGKQEWIDASCSITWHWFEVTVRRALELDNACVVESWIRQSRDPVSGEDDSPPVAAAGVVLDVWANEGGTWRLVARYPQRAGD
jgi:ketosteroid isomerase-like protein